MTPKPTIAIKVSFYYFRRYAENIYRCLFFLIMANYRPKDKTNKQTKKYIYRRRRRCCFTSSQQRRHYKRDRLVKKTTTKKVPSAGQASQTSKWRHCLGGTMGAVTVQGFVLVRVCAPQNPPLTAESLDYQGGRCKPQRTGGLLGGPSARRGAADNIKQKKVAKLGTPLTHLSIYLF